MKSHFVGAAACLALSAAGLTYAQAPAAPGNPDAGKEDWIQLFNGTDLSGWTPKIRRYELGDNYGNTFRVAGGLLSVRYDKKSYPTYDNRFGHLFYKEPFSYYKLVVEYRFVGEQVPGAPAWALRNSGAMLHSPSPRTMPRDQDFPISIEAQFLGGAGDGKPRSTGNLCTPGTDVVYNGAIYPDHCLNSSSKTYDGDQWVRAELVVHGSSLLSHYINGEKVLEYSSPQYGGGQVAGHLGGMKQDGKLIDSGYISLQSESHPIDFRKVELLNLAGCMDKNASNYKSYYVHSVPESCQFAKDVKAAMRRPGEYPSGPDSLPQEGVSKGRLEGPFEFKSSIIANTVRRYWIYVPAQYNAKKPQPANVLVFQDGQRATNPKGPLQVPQVLENLIYKGEIPVTIGIFVTPGYKPADGETLDKYPDNLNMSNPNNRRYEYDVLSDDYARMIIEELLPEVGKKYKLTDDPEKRVIGGTSSGAIAAFTVAWTHPEAFRNVISMIGSYTSIGYTPATASTALVPGGDLYPTLIRKNPIKPIKIYLQDGSADLSNEHGNWYLANLEMLSAFEYANAKADRDKSAGPRYQVNHEWGDGGHSDAHGGALLPDILRWIWPAK
jgi:hypothetical protein